MQPENGRNLPELTNAPKNGANGLRMGNGRLRLVGALATIPAVAVGYATVDMNSLSMQIELALSGANSAHGRQTTATAAEKPRVLVPYEARRLFLAEGKGPRADLYLEVHRSSYTPKAPRRVVATLTPVDIEVSGRKVGKGTKDHVVNRKKKGERLKAPVTTIVRQAPKTVKVTPPPAPSTGTAELLLASVRKSLDHQFDGTHAPHSTGLSAKPKIAAISRGMVFKGETEADYQTRQRRCLASAIYFEARGEPRKGQIAVAQVVMNRVRSPAFPDTICGVVFQGQHQRKGCQFSFTCDGISDVARSEAQWRVSNKLAKQVLKGDLWVKEIDNSTHYHANYVSPPWRRQMKRIKKIGRHIFYRAPAVPIREKTDVAEASASKKTDLVVAQNEPVAD